MKKKPGLRESINKHCKQCMGHPYEKNVVKSIRACPSQDCALWQVRPYQVKPPRKPRPKEEFKLPKYFKLSLERD